MSGFRNSVVHDIAKKCLTPQNHVPAVCPGKTVTDQISIYSQKLWYETSEYVRFGKFDFVYGTMES